MSPIREFTHIPVELPREAVLKRMGYNKHLTQMSAEQQRRIDSLMQGGYALCAVRGRTVELPVENITPEGVEAGGLCFASRYLAEAMAGAQVLVLMAASSGEAISAKSAESLAAGDGVAGLVYDAVGSEVTDNALDWIQNLMRRELPRRGLVMSKMRFSPGYGDLVLAEQRKIYQELKLEEIGIHLTESCIMLPEKSVCAIAGLMPGC